MGDDLGPAIVNGRLTYKVDHENRGNIYVINYYGDEISAEVARFQESFTHLGFRPPRPNGVDMNYLIRDIQRTTNFTQDDCVCAVYVAKGFAARARDFPGELEFLKLFHSDRNENFRGKPKLLFLVYERERVLKSQMSYGSIESDSDFKRLPVEADLHVVRVGTPDARATLARIGDVARAVQRDTCARRLCAEIVRRVRADDGADSTVFSTLTARLRLGPKELRRVDRRRAYARKRNELLKFLIEQLLCDVDESQAARDLVERHSLRRVLGRLRLNVDCEIADRERIVSDLEDFYAQDGEQGGAAAVAVAYGFSLERLMLALLLVYVVYIKFFHEA